LLYVSNCQNKMCVLSNITRPRLIKLSYGQHVKIMQYTSFTRHISFSALPIELWGRDWPQMESNHRHLAFKARRLLYVPFSCL